MIKIKNYILAATFGVMAASCSDFLDEQLPQGTLSEDQVSNPAYVEKQVTSAYAALITMEDINASFSLWNYDVRSDDAYKGGSSPSDGDVFGFLEIEQGVTTTAWNANDIWVRLYNAISRANAAIHAVKNCDESYKAKDQRLAELYFIRAYEHFQLKRLFKNVPLILNPDLTYEQYSTIKNTEFSNDEAWKKIADDLEYAYGILPETQAEKGRPTKGACAAFLAKVYLYKAYRQDDANTHQVTSINEEDLKMVEKYTDPELYKGGEYHLESDFHNNFRPEERFENGCESLWAIQYSKNDGTKYGQLNYGYGLIPPNIAGVIDGGCDFYKPSQNLVNAFRTNDKGLPMLDNFNNDNYDMANDNADPRLFLTVGMPGLPYMFNPNFIMDESSNWSRSGGQYGYNVSLKHNVDPALLEQYLIKGSFWGSSMNRIVFRYADVMLMRAEALIQLNKNNGEAIKIINDIRKRANESTQMIANYPTKYGVKIYCKTYPEGVTYSKDEAMKMLKMERRLEFAMESERFLDLVRWGEAAEVLNAYFAKEMERCNVYGNPKDGLIANFTKNKNEYLPIPHERIAEANGNFKQNIGGW